MGTSDDMMAAVLEGSSWFVWVALFLENAGNERKKDWFFGLGQYGDRLFEGLASERSPSPKSYNLRYRYSKTPSPRTTLWHSHHDDNDELVAASDILLLAVKPQVLKPILSSARSSLAQKNPILMSMVTGTSVATLREWSASRPSFEPCPITPASIGEGMSALLETPKMERSVREAAEYVFSAIGSFVWLNDEELINVVTAVSGSGPAYFFLFFEAMRNVAVELGMTEDLATRLVLQTAVGAAKLAQASDDDVATLRRQVTALKERPNARLEFSKKKTLKAS